MTGSFSAVWGRRRPGARSLFRLVYRTLVESLYLLTAPVTAAAGLLLAFGGLCVATVGLLMPGGSPVVARALAPTRSSADLERWRIARVRPPAAGADGPGQRSRPKQVSAASDPGLWLEVAHAVVVLRPRFRHVHPAQPVPVRRVAAARDPVPGQRPVPHRRKPRADVAGRAGRLRYRGRPAAAVRPAAGDPGVHRGSGRAGAGAAV